MKRVTLKLPDGHPPDLGRHQQQQEVEHDPQATRGETRAGQSRRKLRHPRTVAQNGAKVGLTLDMYTPTTLHPVGGHLWMGREGRLQGIITNY
jgi:hypothetical protein